MAAERVSEPLYPECTEVQGYTYRTVTDTTSKGGNTHSPVAVQRRVRMGREVLGGWSTGTRRTRSYDWAGGMSEGNPAPWENGPPSAEGCTSVK